MRISDWSSDVCSSDLHRSDTGRASVDGHDHRHRYTPRVTDSEAPAQRRPGTWRRGADTRAGCHLRDRKSVGEGKRVAVRVDLGGRRIIKKKKNHNHKLNNDTKEVKKD